MLISLLTGRLFSFFFFNDTATTEIYTLSLHDALPIFRRLAVVAQRRVLRNATAPALAPLPPGPALASRPGTRSEEHTSELQSQSNLVCRLLLEKKKRIAVVTMSHASPSLQAYVVSLLL